MKTEIIVIKKLTHCSRCGGNHAAVTFFKFVRPPLPETHWGLCPRTGDPILMRVTK